MLSINVSGEDEVRLSGRFDAAQAERAREVFAAFSRSCVIDCRGLEYISSAGIGVLLSTYARLRETGHTIKLTNVDKYVRDVLRYAGLDRILQVE